MHKPAPVGYSHLSPGPQLDAVQRLNRLPDADRTATTTATDERGEKAAASGGAEVVDLPVEP
jgi:hypothetical protein